MHLSSHVITSLTTPLTSSLNSSFQHHFQLCQVTSQHGQSSIMNMLLNSMGEATSDSSCLIAYNCLFDAKALVLWLDESGYHWECDINHYDLRTGELKSSEKLDSLMQSNFKTDQILHKSDIYIQEATISTTRNSSKNKIFFLPPSLKGHKQIIGSDYQMLKLINYIKGYITVEQSPQQSVLFQSDLSCTINSFLYEQKVTKISIFVNYQGSQTSDDRVLAQLGMLKVPEKWRQKDSYRQIKRQIFVLKAKDNSLHRQLKQMHRQVTQNVNDLQVLAGFPQLCYNQISIEVLKKLKQQCFSDKVNHIADARHSLQTMDLRLAELRSRKQQLQQNKQNLQNQQLGEMLDLKNSVISLQTSQVNPQASQESKLIFKRDKPKNQAKKQLVTTILFRAHQKKQENQSSGVLISSDNRSKHKVSVKAREQLLKKTEFKSINKTFAAIVKQGDSTPRQLNFHKLQEELQTDKLQIDFEVEKELHNKRVSYQKAFRVLQNTIEGSEDISFL